MTRHGPGAHPTGWHAPDGSGRRTASGVVAAMLCLTGLPGTVLAQSTGVPAVSAAAGPPDRPPCPTASAGAALRRIAGEHVDIAWRPLVDTVTVGQPFAIEFEVCQSGPPTTIDRLRVDAWMPEHKHGMNYRTTLSGARPGPLRAEGLLFHMPGRWQVVFEMRAGERALRLTDELTVR
jgi:hypothetical protein